MPIADCGFPAINVTFDQDGKPQVTPGNVALVTHGPTTQVEIGFSSDMFHPDPAKVAAAVQAAHSPPAPRIVEALIDTGAGDSAIDEELAQELAQELGLPLIDRVDGSGIGGTEKFNVYLGHIRVTALGFIQYGRFMGVKLKAGSQRHSALIGRTLLRSTVLVYDGRDGTVRIAM